MYAVFKTEEGIVHREQRGQCPSSVSGDNLAVCVDRLEKQLKLPRMGLFPLMAASQFPS